jgi:ubiquinone/menaquinone biosynthesis C-methylase UbiE
MEYQHQRFCNLRVSQLVGKIFKCIPSNDRDIIIDIIRNTAGSSNCTKLTESLTSISTIVRKYIMKNNIKRDPLRQDFIVGKIISYLNIQLKPRIKCSLDALKWVDFGGGNGNVLSGINNALTERQSKPENFICVETNKWVEKYLFNNENITYMFWNNETVDIEDASIDIVLCMVSLHHMTDETISNVLKEAYRILKPDGLFFLKEHSMTRDSYYFIQWEHHLYHILDISYDGQIFNSAKYFNNSIENYKPKEMWARIIQNNGFSLLQRLNRFLDGDFNNGENEYKNATNLYWDVYTKI